MESECPCLSDGIFVVQFLQGSLTTDFVTVSSSPSFLDGMNFSVFFVDFYASDDITLSNFWEIFI